jgi:hypothetical protein
MTTHDSKAVAVEARHANGEIVCGVMIQSF